jgi:eukaryotic-like serine/threonine-protein kinase
MIGRSLIHYKVITALGAGGMGAVYLAEDTRLNRLVAIKLLPAEFATDTVRLARLQREARVLAQLEHPNIAALHALEEAAPDGIDAPVRFLVMQFAEGETLARRIESAGPIPVDEALGIARQIGAALEAAHDKGVVHRDLKPANVMVADDGRVKVVDFGIARSLGSGGPDAVTGDPTSLTVAGALLGTLPYMSPEQACGQQADSAADVWAFGCLLFEMLTGARAFGGNSAAATIAAILDHAPDFERLPRDVPVGVRGLIRQCLQKSPDRRPPSGRALREALTRIEARRAGVGLAGVLRRPRVVVPLAVAVIAAAAMSAAVLARQRQINWVHRTALPQIEHLLGEEELDPAFRLFVAAERVLPGIPEIEALRPFVTRRFSVATTPPGARVWTKGYRATDAEWLDLGTTPIEAALAPAGFLRFRIEKAGHVTLEAARVTGEAGYSFTLWPEGEGPEGMVFVPGSFVLAGQAHTEADFAGCCAETGDFWIDRHEVTNQRFKAFVDAGGYQRAELWKHSFALEDGTELRWAGAMSRFTDATGRPGPAAWEVGTFADGTGQHPVAGISWHEAAAYCAFVGKDLPTVYHWLRAAGIPEAAGRSLHEIALLGNSVEAISGSVGPKPVRAKDQATSWHGAYDMSGNVREWVFNSDDSGFRRYLFGGAWDDPTYLFWSHPDASSPWERSLRDGFRCASYAAKEGVRDPIVRQLRDYRREEPVSADVFAAYRMLYAFQPHELRAVVDQVDDSSPYYRKEVISFDAAYGGERVTAHLLLPTQAGSPPYQAVVYFPGLSAFLGGLAPSATDTAYFRPVVLSGRAVIYPFYKGTHTRRDTSGLTASEVRIRQSLDLARSIDYLETRPDIDAGRVAFFGFSLGGSFGPIFTALEPRFAASILLAGGFMSDRPAPEIDPFNFVTRSTVPTLMIQGRWDAIRPLQTHTGPMFELLGTPDEHKRLALVDGGHIVPLNPVIREVLDWLDRYLGPVSSQEPGPR